jgi:PrtD family type I secretion system ABC transporter
VRQVIKALKRFLVSAAIFTACINILALSGSLFMLQVYDRVLPSHSIETLVALTALVVLLYVLSGLLDLVRTRLFARIGRYADLSLQGAVFDLNLKAATPANNVALSGSVFKDLEQIRNFLAGGGPSALFDLPWMPLYVVMLFLLHPYIGFLGLIGILSLVTVTWLADRAMSPYQKKVYALTGEANGLAQSVTFAAETVKSLGMAPRLRSLWSDRSLKAGESVIDAADTSAIYSGLSRFFRTSLQSLVLAIGAYLVITGKATGGVMIASSILLGKALSPVELAISHWRGFIAARDGYDRLERGLEAPPENPNVALPHPTEGMIVEGLTIGVGGQPPVLNNLNFTLQAGDALGVMGASGSGKSTLARALIGLWPLLRGTVRFDGATLDQWSESERARFIGYMPQEISLFAGTVANNISRFEVQVSSNEILAATRLAGAEQFVLGLPDGFDTSVGDRGTHLSVGQRQRIALARTFYGAPFVVILDEPNSALDAEGEQALIAAITAVRERRGIAIVIAHRPQILQAVSKLLIVGDGQQKAFGPRDEVLRAIIAPSMKKSGSAG